MRDEKKPVLVLGGEGFVGSHLVERIPGAIPLDDRSFCKHRFPHTIVKSICDPLDAEIAASGLVIHAACRDIRTSMRAPMEDARVNIEGTLNVLMACRRHQVPILYISSVSVEHEVSHYAVSKSAGERYTRMYRQWVPTAVVRLSNVFGPRDTESVIARWIREPEIALITAEATRDFTYIEDSVAGILRAVEAWPDEPVNICTGVETRLGDLAAWLAKRMSKPVKQLPPREIDNVIQRVVNAEQAAAKIGFRARWSFYQALEEYLAHYDHPVPPAAPLV